MAIQDYIPNKDGKFAELLTHVRTTLPTYYVTLGITAATQQVIIQTADALTFAHMLAQQGILIAGGQAATREKDRARKGDPTNPNVPVNLAYPSAPSTTPSPVLPGIEARFRDFVEWLRALPAYDEGIGQALNIIGAESTGPDLATLKPVLPLRIAGGRVEIDWGWQGNGSSLDALEIQVDRGNGIFVMLTIDTRPDYVDTEPLPATATKWKYKAIYRKDDGRVGLWSDVADITVGG